MIRIDDLLIVNVREMIHEYASNDSYDQYKHFATLTTSNGSVDQKLWVFLFLFISGRFYYCADVYLYLIKAWKCQFSWNSTSNRVSFCNSLHSSKMDDFALRALMSILAKIDTIWMLIFAKINKLSMPTQCYWLPLTSIVIIQIRNQTKYKQYNHC